MWKLAHKGFWWYGNDIVDYRTAHSDGYRVTDYFEEAGLEPQACYDTEAEAQAALLRISPDQHGVHPVLDVEEV